MRTLLSKVYINLIDQKEPLFQFQNENENTNINSTKPNNYSKKIIKITQDEYKKHKNF